MLLVIRQALQVLFPEFYHMIAVLWGAKGSKLLCEDYWWDRQLLILIIKSFSYGVFRVESLYNGNFLIIVLSCAVFLIGIIRILMGRLILDISTNVLIRIVAAIDFVFLIVILLFLISSKA